MSLNVKVTPQFTATYTRVKGYGLATFDLARDHPVFQALGASGISFADGTGTGAADLLWLTNGVTPPTLAASASVTIDLNGLTDDALGDDIALAKVKIICVYADPGNLNDLLVGPGVSNGFLGPFSSATNRQTVRPGGIYLNIDPGVGFTVTPTTADQFFIGNAAGTNVVTYHALIAGASV